MGSHDARTFFDAIARRYDRVYALSGSASRQRLANVLRLIEGRSRVLVLGLGTGRELPALLDAGHVPTGLDVSAEMIALCNKRSRTVPTVRADFYEPLPFPDDAYDAVIALHGTLAHPPSEVAIAGLANEVARVLAPGGVFVAEVPAAEALTKLAEAPAEQGLGVVVTGPTTFKHHDDVAGVELEGIALDRAGWERAFGGALDVRIEPLGQAEYLCVGQRRPPRI